MQTSMQIFDVHVSQEEIDVLDASSSREASQTRSTITVRLCDFGTSSSFAREWCKRSSSGFGED